MFCLQDIAGFVMLISQIKEIVPTQTDLESKCDLLTNIYLQALAAAAYFCLVTYIQHAIHTSKHDTLNYRLFAGPPCFIAPLRTELRGAQSLTLTPVSMTIVVLFRFIQSQLSGMKCMFKYQDLEMFSLKLSKYE